MHPDKQRIKIAEICGVDADYLNDLNAMHEAEKRLFDTRDWRLIRAYFKHLSPNIDSDESLDSDDWKICHATAPQRAEAFLKTFGEWKEDDN